MLKLKRKYVFHIPLFRFVCDEIEAVEIDELLNDLLDTFNREGFENFYISKVQAYYKKRSFDELLITMFADSDLPEDIFERWFLKNNDVLCQEAFAYECGNSMIIRDLM